MVIKKCSKYLKNYKKILNDHRNDLIEIILKIEQLLIESPDFYKLITNPLSKVYKVEKLVGDKVGSFSARIGKKERVIFNPNVEPPYNYLEIDEILMEEINRKHYKK